MRHPQYRAGGNIYPRRFVTVSSAFTVTQSSTGDIPEGISQSGTRGSPNTPFDDGLAAASGQQLLVYGLGDTALIDTGAAVTAGVYLKSDANGRAIPVTSSGDAYGAMALDGASASGISIRVEVIRGVY